jgi:Fe-S cluster biogenesis protein NfuA
MRIFMIDRQSVEDALQIIRPTLQADGGDVQLVNVTEDGVVEVELQGACKGCPMSQLTLANSVERVLKNKIPEITKVVPAG